MHSRSFQFSLSFVNFLLQIFSTQVMISMCRQMSQRKTTLLNVLLCFRLSILQHFIEREATQGQAKLNQKKLLYNNPFSFVCELFLLLRNSLINMLMSSHSATRLAEIDMEINSRPYGNNMYLVTEWEGRTGKLDLRSWRTDRAQRDSCVMTEATKLLFICNFHSCYNFWLSPIRANKEKVKTHNDDQ